MFLKQKYSSRKFWCAVINAIINLIVLTITDNQAVELAALAFITIGFVAFILCEAVVDCVSMDSLTVHVHRIEKKEKEEPTDDDRERAS